MLLSVLSKCQFFNLLSTCIDICSFVYLIICINSVGEPLKRRSDQVCEEAAVGVAENESKM